MFKYQWRDVDATAEDANAKLLRLVPANRNVLEIGCATGYVSKAMSEQLHCRVTGIEIDRHAALQAEKYCERVIVGDVEEIDFSAALGEERFDVITFGDVLEHLRNPGRILAELRPFLKSEGYLLASLPNIAHISVALELLQGRFDYRPVGLLDESHVRFYTKSSILSLFRNSGYEVVLWDRVIVRPQDTEFETVLSSYPRSVLSFIEGQSEARTYQFIVKATPCTSLSENEAHREAAKTALEELRSTVERQERSIRELEKKLAILSSIASSRSWRLTAPFRVLWSLVRAGGKRGSSA